MNQHTRKHDRHTDDSPSGGMPGNENLASLRRAGEDLGAAGDEAIRRGLSNDSANYLESMRQEGGQ